MKEKRLLLAHKYVLLVGKVGSSVALIQETLVTYDYW
jgi:hypothetical protein